MKRYAIVRVDNNCPFYTELVTTKCWIYKNDKSCFKCKIKKTYGDTKEQLVRKVVQVMMRKYSISYFRTTMQDKINPKHLKSAYDYYLDLAKEIVEFLGVK